MKRSITLWLIIMGLSSVWAGTVPNQITYQGTLKEQGIPVTGTRTMLFRLTNSDGSAVYWSGGNTDVVVSQGLFSTLLVPTGVDWQNVSPYIELSVSGQLLLPREPISATAYSFMSGTVVDGAITNSKIAPGAIAGTQIANQTITAIQIANGTITGTQIANGTINGTQLIDGTITGTQIANATIAGANLVNGTITGTQIANQTIAGTQLQNATITPTQLAANSVTMPALDPSVSNYLIPVGMVALFVNACPAGWNEVTALRGRTPFGTDPGNPLQFTLGQQGGSLSHQHVISPDGGHTHTLGLPTTKGTFWAFGTQQGSGSGQYYFAQDDHVHSVTTVPDHSHGGFTGSFSTLPPYVTMLYCSKS